MNQTLLDMTSCLLIESGVTKELWADAVVTASYIRNKCPSKAVGGESPEALWTGGEVKLDHLRVFGCKAWSVRNRPRKGDKLDPKAEMCILVGYPDGVKGYKLWNQKEDRFFVSRNVVFEEDSFPCKLAKSASSNVEGDNDISSTILFRVEDSEPYDVCGSNHDDTENNNPEEFGSLADEDEKVTQDEVALQQPSSAPNQGTQALRRSERLVNKRRPQVDCLSCCIAKRTNQTDPETLHEALSAPDKEKWKAALQSELDSLQASKTWELVPRPKDRKVVKCKWVFRKKYDENGHLQRYKARLVACGYSQVEGTDYKETFSPVVKLKSIRTLLAIAVERNWKILQVDITAAYLHGTLKETIYMEQPQLFGDHEKDKVCLLKKSLYGLRQSGRE
ncbi:hypothetical protein MTO96_049220 [Rhipicephalus appendiculatus]